MKKALTILLISISFNCFSTDKWVKFHEIPKPVKTQIDSLHFKNCLMIGDTLYLVKEKYKSTTKEILYRGDGLVMDTSMYYDSPAIGLVGLGVVVVIFIKLLFFK